MIEANEKAYAKINLFLDVVSRREDGFHNIETVMQTVSLADEVSVSVDMEGEPLISVSVSNNPSIPTDEKSLVYKAIKRFLDAIDKRCYVQAHLTSNIPTEAGLAGGSADAAAALRAVARIFGNPLSESEMLSIAASIGSDVAFCYKGGCAFCEGRGEIITSLKNNTDIGFVVAKGQTGMSTPRAYSALDVEYSDFNGSKPTNGPSYRDKLFAALSCGGDISECIYNVFESVVIREVPEIEEIKDIMIKNGASAAMMSGSGTAVFGVFHSDCDRHQCIDVLRELGYFAQDCTAVF